MRAMVMRAFGASDVLRLEDVPAPVPGPGMALVRVVAVEVSRTRDVATRTGRHPFSRQVALPHVLGGDFAGVVEAVGTGVEATLVGKRVAGMNTQTCGVCRVCRSGRSNECADLVMLGIHRWGSYAELVTVPVESLHALPDGLDLVQAAALAATGPIALAQLRVGLVAEGSRVLVPGVTGALATVLAALATDLGAQVLGLTRRVDAVPQALRLDVLDSTRPDLSEAVLAATQGAGPDCVVDNVAAPEVFARYFPTLANGARIVISGALGSPDLPVLQVPAAPLYVRSISLLGVRTAPTGTMLEFWELVRQGFRLPPGLVHEMPLEAAAQAHDAIAAGTPVAHTVLRVATMDRAGDATMDRAAD